MAMFYCSHPEENGVALLFSDFDALVFRVGSGLRLSLSVPAFRSADIIPLCGLTFVADHIPRRMHLPSGETALRKMSSAGLSLLWNVYSTKMSAVTGL